MKFNVKAKINEIVLSALRVVFKVTWRGLISVNFLTQEQWNIHPHFSKLFPMLNNSNYGINPPIKVFSTYIIQKVLEG